MSAYTRLPAFVAPPRSSRREVRNPILALPAADAIGALPRDQRLALARLLSDLAKQARANADRAWEMRKPPMAAYWAACAVWAKHIAAVLRRP